MEQAADLAALLPIFRAEGIRALAFVPLVYQGRLLGKFMLYYGAPHAFTPEELRLASTVAQHMSFGFARVEGDEAAERLLRREQAARRDADAARAEAVRASRGKDEFLAMLAHELRNPLSVIVNAVALLDASPGRRPACGRARRMVQRQADHLARLLDDLLDVARITAAASSSSAAWSTCARRSGFAVESQRARSKPSSSGSRSRSPARR